MKRYLLGIALMCCGFGGLSLGAAQTGAAAPEETPADVWETLVQHGEQQMSDGDYVAAEETYRKSLAYAEQHNLGAEQLVESSNQLGWALRSEGRFEEAEKVCRSAIAVGNGSLDKSNIMFLEAKVGLGRSLTSLQQYDAAEDILLDALNTLDAQPKQPLCAVSDGLDALTNLYIATHQYQKGGRIFTETFALMTKTETPCGNYVALLKDLSRLYGDNHQWEFAEKIERARASLVLGMSGAQSELYGDALFALAQSLENEHRPDEAASTYAQAADVFRKLDPVNWDKVTDSLEQQEINLKSARKPEAASRVHQTMLVARSHSDVGNIRGEMMSWRSRGIEALRQWNVDLAAQCVAKELEVSKKLTAADQMIALGDDAALHQAQQNTVAEESDLKQVLALSIASTGASSYSTANAYHELGWFYQRQHRYAEAEASYLAALPLYQARDTNDLERVLLRLSTVYRLQGKYDQAEPILQRTAKLEEDTHNDLRLCVALQNLAEAYGKTNRPQEAEATFARAMKIAASLEKPMNLQWATAALSEAAFYEQTGRPQQAEQLYLSALAFMEQEAGSNSPVLRLPLDALITLLKTEGRLGDAAKYEARRDQLPGMPPMPTGGLPQR